MRSQQFFWPGKHRGGKVARAREIASLSVEKVRKLGAEYLKSVADRAIE
jgi:hypothetical protein